MIIPDHRFFNHVISYIADSENSSPAWARDVIKYVNGQPPNVFSHHRVLLISGSTIKKELVYEDGEKITKYLSVLSQDSVTNEDIKNVKELRRVDDEEKDKLSKEVPRKDLELKTIDLLEFRDESNEKKFRIKEFVKQVHNFKPTIVVISFLGAKCFGTSEHFEVLFNHIVNVDIFRNMESGNLEVDEDSLETHPDYLIFNPKNIFCEEGVYVTSATRTGGRIRRTGGRDEVYIKNAIWNFHKKIGTQQELRTLIISGSHGTSSGKDASTSSDQLDQTVNHGFNNNYKEMCDLAGVHPSSNLDGVNNVFVKNKHNEWPKSAQFLSQEHEKLRIHVLNIEHFTKTNHHQCKDRKCSHSKDERIDDLLEVVKGLKPQFVVIDWCWSRNGD